MDPQHDPESESGALWEQVDADDLSDKRRPPRESGALMRRGRGEAKPKDADAQQAQDPAAATDELPKEQPAGLIDEAARQASQEAAPPSDPPQAPQAEAEPEPSARQPEPEPSAAQPEPETAQPPEAPAAPASPAAGPAVVDADRDTARIVESAHGREAAPRQVVDHTAIRLIDLHKSFGKLNVLDGVSLDIEAARCTVIVGPSGTGKSVLLKHIVGLVRPDAGEVWFEGSRLDTMSDRELVDARMRMGFLFQMGALFDSMSVAANICFPLREHTKLTAAQRDERCNKVLAMVGLPDAAGKMPADLSGGQRKRVALARAIVLEPALVLYDEPTTGLDPITADVINELIVVLNEKLGITSIVVTHDMASARKVADRIVMLYGGKVLADGETETFLNCADDLVQRFIKGQADAEDLRRIRQGFE